MSLPLGAHPKVPETTPPRTELTPLPLTYIPRQWKPSLQAKPTRPMSVHGWNVPKALARQAPSLHLETQSLDEHMLVCLKPTRPAARCSRVPMPCSVAPTPSTLLPANVLCLCTLLSGVPTNASGAWTLRVAPTKKRTPLLDIPSRPSKTTTWRATTVTIVSMTVQISTV